MSISWITEEGLLTTQIEGSDVEEYIEYTPNAIFSVLVNDLPDTISIYKVSDGKYKLIGKLPIVSENTTYNIVCRITDGNEIIDRCFNIKSINLSTSWKNTEEIVEAYSFNETNIDIRQFVNNLNGDEEFRFYKGKLPDGLELNNGKIIGSVSVNVNIDTTYPIYIAIFRNNEQLDIGSLKLNIVVVKSSENAPPYWITPEGVIGTLYYNYKADSLYVLAGCDDDVTYEIKYRIYTPKEGEDLISSSLPNVSFNDNGKFSGQVKTSQHTSWTYYIVADKVEKEGLKRVVSSTEPRKFIISTNPPASDDIIIWNDSADLGTIKTGFYITGKFTAYCKSGKNITYTISSGDVPLGLKLSVNGEYSGRILYQPFKEYAFIIKATNGEDSVYKIFYLTVEKGFGKSSVKCYLRMNNENKSEYNDIKNKLSTSASYKSTQELFQIGTEPIIDVAYLECFDRELLSYLLGNWRYGNEGSLRRYGNDEVITFDITKTKDFTRTRIIDDSDESLLLNSYQVFYKPVVEKTLQWEELEIDNKYDYSKDIEDDEYLDFNCFNTEELKPENDKHNKFVLKGELSTSKYVKEYECDIFNIENVRKLLSKPLIVEKLGGVYYYESGNQHILLDEEEYNTYPSLTVKFNESSIDVSPSNTFDESLKYTFENGLVYCNGMVVMNTIIKYDNDEKLPYIIMNTNPIKPMFLKRIENPYIYKCNNYSNMSIIPDCYEDIVLPYITDEDVFESENGLAIRFLNELTEYVPEWKRQEPILWTSNAEFEINDIIICDNVYYKVIAPYTSSSTFVYDTNTLKKLTEKDIDSELPIKYFPTLDVLYSAQGYNHANLIALNNKERKGEYWTGTEFRFQELFFSSLFEETDIQDIVRFSSTIQNFDTSTSFEYEIADLEGELEEYPLDNRYKIRLYSDVYDNVLITCEINGITYTNAGLSNYIEIRALDGEQINWTANNSVLEVSGSVIASEDANIEIIFNESGVKLTIVPTPSISDVVLKYDGNIKRKKVILVNPNTEVTYEVSCDGYITKTDTITVVEDTVVNVDLEQNKVQFTITTTPSNAVVKMKYNGIEETTKTINVYSGTEVTYEVSCDGYVTKSDSIMIVSDTSLNIELIPNFTDDYLYEIINNDIYLKKYIGTNSNVDAPSI